MKELTPAELNEVNGGVLPFVSAAIAVYSHITASTVTGAILGRVGLAGAIYGVGEYLSDS